MDQLEPRRLLSATPPALVAVELRGPVGGVNAVVLTFSAPLDPVSAQDVRSYALGKPAAQGPDDSIGLDDFLPFTLSAGSTSSHGNHGPAKAQQLKAVRHGKLQFTSAAYDDAAHTVTLTPVKPFKATAFFKVLRVKGTGPNILKDDAGAPFNAGADRVVRWTLKRGKAIRYTDPQNNHVGLTLHGKGKLYVFCRKAGGNAIIFVDAATSASTITGTVTHAGGVFSATTIEELNGAQSVPNNLLNDPNFQVRAID